MALASVSPITGIDLFCGIDVDSKSFSFTVNDRDGMIRKSKKIPADPELLWRYLQRSFPEKKVLCGYEAGPTGYHLYDCLSAKKVPCVVIPPASLPKSPDSRVKTNRIDSNRIALYLQSGKAREVRVPDEAYRELRHLVDIRQRYAHDIGQTKQRIKALLLYTHLDIAPAADSRWSQAHIARLKALKASPAVGERLALLLEDLDYGRGKMSRAIKSLRGFCRANPDIDRYRSYLESIPGVGLATALAVLARIGDPRRLKNVRELGAFFGLVPTERSTGDDIRRGFITHLGNDEAHALLVEASWVAIRSDAELAQFYYRIRSRHHQNCASKKAIVAVARKLTNRIYAVLTEERPYIRR